MKAVNEKLKGKRTYIVIAILYFMENLVTHPTIAMELHPVVQIITDETILLTMTIMRALTGDTVTAEIRQDLADYRELKRQIFNLNQQKGTN